MTYTVPSFLIVLVIRTQKRIIAFVFAIVGRHASDSHSGPSPFLAINDETIHRPKKLVETQRKSSHCSREVVHAVGDLAVAPLPEERAA